MQKHDEVLETNRKKIFVNNFIGGVAWGLGSTIAITIFAALLTFILSKLDFVAIVGTFLHKLNQFMMANPS